MYGDPWHFDEWKVCPTQKGRCMLHTENPNPSFVIVLLIIIKLHQLESLQCTRLVTWPISLKISCWICGWSHNWLSDIDRLASSLFMQDIQFYQFDRRFSFVTDVTHSWASVGPSVICWRLGQSPIQYVVMTSRISWQTLITHNSVTVVFVLCKISFS